MDTNLRGTALNTIRTLFTSGTVGGMTDGELLERFTARDGDSAELAFAGLVERHGFMVLRVCRNVLRDSHEAEDAFQATFLILALKAGSIRTQNSLTSWLYSVAYHVAATARSSAARRRLHELKAGQSRSLACTEDARDDLAPVIHQELDRIPERYRAVLVLCCLEGLSQQQAAKQLGWPLGTVQSRLARGRERLRARLARRGLAPATGLSMSPLALDVTHVAMPAALASSTVRLAVTITSARAIAIGTVPEGIMRLAKRTVTTMFMNKVLTTGAAAVLVAAIMATGAAVHAYQASKAGPSTTQNVVVKKEKGTPENAFDDGLLTVTGVVRMRDGRPAVGATVRSFTGSREASSVARTDETGFFQLRGVFGNGCSLRVSSADETYQALRNIPTVVVRSVLSAPLELTLLPAFHHDLTVLSEGRPVAGAHVAAVGIDFEVQGITGGDGKLRLRVPAKEPVTVVVAWHPTLGASGKRDLETHSRQGATQLSLLPPAPLSVRVIDALGKPVGGLELGVSVHPENSDWISASYIKASHVRTDDSGTATVPWAPRENLQYVDVDLLGPDWKLDEIDLTLIKTRKITVHARREQEVQGRLIMPAGSSAEGILITGFGFGPANIGTRPFARARRDGTFTLRVPSEHGFVLGIVDLKWAGDPWTGVIRGEGSAKPALPTMTAYLTTPLTVRVTRGPRRDPVAKAWIDLTSRAEVKWTDGSGKKKSGTGGAGTWLVTDALGIARAGVGKGPHELRLSTGNWNEERKFQVTSEKPLEFEFHRPWIGQRKITGRLTANGAPYASSTFVARAWEPQEARVPLAFELVSRSDGTFEVSFDAPALSVFVVDRDQKRSGFVLNISEEGRVDVDMEAMAESYSGTLLDERGRPMADRTLEIYVKTSPHQAGPPQQTDKQGRFRFTNLPCKVPLQLSIRNESDGPQYFLFDRDRMFEPREVRENDQLKPHRADESSARARAYVPLATSVENICRNVRSSGMRALVALMGDDSQDAARTIDQLFDYDEERTSVVLNYLTIRVDAAQLKREAAVVSKFGWPKPGPGAIVLVALDGDQKSIATERIGTKNVESAVGSGVDFLNKHRLPARNALTLLAKARADAKSSGRRVWVIEGGPRCGPCFRLARWIEDRHAVLEKDFVVVKLMAGIDEHVTEALAGLPIKQGDGIPWFAFTEPDGTVLAISRGPLGNMGFPSSVEDLRHFRGMLERAVQRLTSADVDRLIESFSAGK
jgi:RNA polymerase sigma factor (sigma-70 family)